MYYSVCNVVFFLYITEREARETLDRCFKLNILIEYWIFRIFMDTYLCNIYGSTIPPAVIFLSIWRVVDGKNAISELRIFTQTYIFKNIVNDAKTRNWFYLPSISAKQALYFAYFIYFFRILRIWNAKIF